MFVCKQEGIGPVLWLRQNSHWENAIKLCFEKNWNWDRDKKEFVLKRKKYVEKSWLSG